jgi:type IV pilus assembly protein PilA
MHKRRQGFTLIELLIVIVIIGILAAIAIPKFGATREKAYFKAMMSDLRNMSAQQEIYYSNSGTLYTYANNVADLQALGFELSSGVVMGPITADSDGWGATVTHTAMGTTRKCGVFHGDAATHGGAGAPATVAGVIECDL